MTDATEAAKRIIAGRPHSSHGKTNPGDSSTVARAYLEQAAKIEVLAAENETLRTERDHLEEQANHYAKECGEAWGIKKKWADRAETAEARNTALEKALETIGNMDDSCPCGSVGFQPDHDAHCPVGVAKAAVELNK